MKKVLIICYYFPPCAGIGIVRPLKLVKYLSKTNWKPVVYTAKDAQYPSWDEKGLEEIPKDVQVLRQTFFEPHYWYKKLLGQKSNALVNNALVVPPQKKAWLHHFFVWIRSNFFIPDARMFWIKPSVKYLIPYLEKNPVDAIITTAPPHSSTVIGLLLKKHFGDKIKWIADFQDPWTQVDYYKRLHLTRWADKKHRQLEQEVFRLADAITIVSETWKKDLEKIGARNVKVIHLGYDKTDFQHITQNLDENFTITHAGLLGDDRHPKGLLNVFARLSGKYPEFRKKAKIQLAGQVHEAVWEDAKKLGITEMVIFKGEMSKHAVNQLNANSQILLLLLNKAENAKGRIPGKFFEYLALGRPILCLGERGSDVEQIIKSQQLGECFDYDDELNLYNFLEKKWMEFTESSKIRSVNHSFEQYTSEEVAKQFLTILKNI